MRALLNPFLPQLEWPKLILEPVALSPAAGLAASSPILGPLSEGFENHPILIGTGVAIAGLETVSYLSRRFSGAFSKINFTDRIMRDLLCVTSVMAAATGIAVATDPMEFPDFLTAGFYGLSLAIFMQAYRTERGMDF